MDYRIVLALGTVGIAYLFLNRDSTPAPATGGDGYSGADNPSDNPFADLFREASGNGSNTGGGTGTPTSSTTFRAPLDRRSGGGAPRVVPKRKAGK